MPPILSACVDFNSGRPRRRSVQPAVSVVLRELFFYSRTNFEANKDPRGQPAQLVQPARQGHVAQPVPQVPPGHPVPSDRNPILRLMLAPLVGKPRTTIWPSDLPSLK